MSYFGSVSLKVNNKMQFSSWVHVMVSCVDGHRIK